ncbi:hypothetical protein AMECASPLE_015224 [Ameca splendens]|uniref:Uncharacterized protein n=1 Tax=Ameca splendens TaxID=208324 RepID=A0ABV0YCW8_9TELE
MTITLSHPHVSIQTLTPLTQPKDTQEWMLYTQSHSPYTVYTLRSRYQYPRGNQLPDPGGGPLQSGVEKGRPPKPPVQTRAGIAQTQTTPAQTLNLQRYEAITK